MGFKKDFNHILKSQSGVALMMILTAIVILTALMVDFSFESKVNKIKAYNIQDRTQARLNAEAGLNFGLTRLRLYKEAFNFVEKNKDAKSFVNQETLNMIWNFPFVYPIPIMPKFSATQKELVKTFIEESLLQGKLNLTIQNISNLMNINLLRVVSFNEDDQDSKSEDSQSEDDENDTSEYNISNQILLSLKNAIESKRDKDPDFYDRYSGIDPAQLVGTLKYYVSDPESYQDDYVAQAESLFQEQEIEPKFAPMATFNEMNQMPGWNDELIGLIRNEFTTHGAIMIDLNKITDKTLKLLIPDINEDETKDFFEYRDDPDTPHFFNKLDDFKKYIVNVASVIDGDDFDERFNNYKKEGIKFGPSPTLFRIKATGSMNRAEYKISAYVSIPKVPEKKKEDKDDDSNSDDDDSKSDDDDSKSDDDDSKSDDDDSKSDDDDKEKEEPPTQLLEPRVIEIFIN